MKNLLMAFFGGLLLMGVSSCKKNNLVIDKDAIIPPEYAEFAVNNTNISYFIKSTGEAYKIPIGITTVSSVDRTIQLSYTSTSGAAIGTQYNAPDVIVIPAGKALDSLTIQGLFDGYPAGRKDTVKIKISGGDAPIYQGRDSVVVVMQRYCDVVLDDLKGNYKKTNEFYNGAYQYGPYITSLTGLVSTGPTTAEGFIGNIYDYGWGDVKALFDWTDPANFTVTIPYQLTNGGGATHVKTTAGQISTFSSCDKTISLSLDLSNGSTLVVSNYKVVMGR